MRFSMGNSTHSQCCLILSKSTMGLCVQRRPSKRFGSCSNHSWLSTRTQQLPCITENFFSHGKGCIYYFCNAPTTSLLRASINSHRTPLRTGRSRTGATSLSKTTCAFLAAMVGAQVIEGIISTPIITTSTIRILRIDLASSA